MCKKSYVERFMGCVQGVGSEGVFREVGSVLWSIDLQKTKCVVRAMYIVTFFAMEFKLIMCYGLSTCRNRSKCVPLEDLAAEFKLSTQVC